MPCWPGWSWPPPPRPGRAGRHAELSVERPPAGPPLRRDRRAGAHRRLRGRPLLRQRLAHHRRDGRHLDAAAEARRRRLVRHRRPVGRARRRSSRAAGATRASPCRHRRAPARAHRLRARRPPRRPVRPQDDQPGQRAAHRHASRSTRTPSCSPSTRGASTTRRTRATSWPTRRRCDGALAVPRAGHAPAPERDAARLRGARRRRAARRPAARSTRRPGHRGPQGTNVCTTRAAAERLRRRPVRQGRRRPAALPGRRSPPAARRRCGSPSPAPTRARARRDRELAAALRHPGRPVRGQDRRARGAGASARGSRSPATAGSQAAVDWGKQNMLDLTQLAEDLKIRWLDQGKEYPAPLGTVEQRPLGRRRLPRLPVDVRHRRRVHVVRERRDRPVRGDQGPHARAARHLRDRQRAARAIVTHEVITDGSNWFGKDQQRRTPTHATPTRPSSSRAPWRWSGAGRATTGSATSCTTSRAAVRAVVERLDEDGDGWPEGSGNVERAGMGAEKLDNTVYLIRGLYDLADMAQLQGRQRHRPLGDEPADGLRARFEGAWWMPAPPTACTRTRSTTRRSTGEQPADKHWIGVTPMEAELTVDGEAVPGLATFEHGDQRSRCTRRTASAASGRTTSACSTRAATAGRTAPGERTIFSLNTAIQAVGEGNYGRLGAGQQQRYTDANVEPMFGEPYTGGTPDEQPGRDAGDPAVAGLRRPANPNIDRCWTCRAMFMQAWGHYGTVWPVVHQQLGVRPDVGRGRLEVVPQLPSADADRRLEHPARSRRAEARPGVTRRRPLPHDGRHGLGAGQGAADRPHAAARLQGRLGHARRAPRQALRRAAHEPRRRGHGRDPQGPAHAGGHDGLGLREARDGRAGGAAVRRRAGGVAPPEVNCGWVGEWL